MGGDHYNPLTKEAAQAQAAEIRQFWALHGYPVTTEVVQLKTAETRATDVHYLSDGRGIAFVVRSDMIGGMPRLMWQKMQDGKLPVSFVMGLYKDRQK